MMQKCLAAALLSTSLLVAQQAYGQAASPNVMATGGNSPGFDMAPETTPEVVDAAMKSLPDKLPAGPFEPTWESVQAHYKAPAWFAPARFGLFMHWGLYSVPAHHNEWYKQHMYGADMAWHTQNFGPPEIFGYKDFIPKFTQEKFDPQAWATLFKKSGAQYVIPTAQHHDNFSLWDSQVNPYNSVAMGPHRDLIGELGKAVKAQGMKFGVSNHGIEAFQFIHLNPNSAVYKDLQAKHADLFDPKWADFYLVADRSPEACRKFLVNWVQRNEELIDKYQPDMLWFDNGVDQRYLDPLKLWVAAYYYNRAATWGKDVSISTKKAAYAPGGDNINTIGSIIDFEKIGARSPAGIRTGEWQVDDPIGSTWGYTEGERITTAAGVVSRLVDTVSKNGNYLLNLSPQADGTINQAQQDTLLGVGNWLQTNGEAIYGTHNWTQFGQTARGGPNIRFTVKGDTLYAIIIGNLPTGPTTIDAINGSQGQVQNVSLLGSSDAVKFEQGDKGLTVTLPANAPGKYAFTLKITGLKTNGSTWTDSGNPVVAAN